LFKCWKNVGVSEHVTVAYEKNFQSLCEKISVTIKGATEKNEKVIKKKNKKKKNKENWNK
jgi:hypothetical protein